ncbi:MAG: type II toxin-antitoxin system VapC family toxin [Armatimonadota bacterium]|nr:type II toxin-antitoxin system VapC family toxin [Armatimonadota bacterium]
MARKPKIKSYVLDSWAVLAYLEDEPHGEKVADVLADAYEAGESVMMTVVNAGEVWYIIARETSEAEAEKSITELKDLGIEFVDVDWKLTHEAAAFKAKHSMSFADCFAAALAKDRKAFLVTGDPEFKQVAGVVQLHIVNEEEW